MKRISIHALALTMILALLVSCSSQDEQQASKDTPAVDRPSADQTSPTAGTLEFTALDLNGVEHSSSEWIGKQPVVINVWGTWCPPCRREIPELVRLFNEYQSTDVKMIGLTVVRNETPEHVEQFAQANGMGWQMLVATQDFAERYQVFSVPTTIFLDKNGEVIKVKDYDGRQVERFVGPRSYDVFKAAFEKIAGSGGSVSNL